MQLAILLLGVLTIPPRDCLPAAVSDKLLKAICTPAGFKPPRNTASPFAGRLGAVSAEMNLATSYVE